MVNHTPIPNRTNNLTGKSFHRWLVIDFSHSKRKHTYWICRCECGTIKPVRADQLQNGESKSCGCWHKEKASEQGRTTTTHGMAGSLIYAVWNGMVRRCTKLDDWSYSRYGQRGIRVCDRWRNSFTAFYEDMGPRPTNKHSLDRIDNNGDYTPDNCRWATRIEQASNTRKNFYLTCSGETHTLAEWSRITGISVAALWVRLRKFNWPVDKALTQPLRKDSRRK